MGTRPRPLSRCFALPAASCGWRHVEGGPRRTAGPPGPGAFGRRKGRGVSCGPSCARQTGLRCGFVCSLTSWVQWQRCGPDPDRPRVCNTELWRPPKRPWVRPGQVHPQAGRGALLTALEPFQRFCKLLPHVLNPLCSSGSDLNTEPGSMHPQIWFRGSVTGQARGKARGGAT